MKQRIGILALFAVSLANSAPQSQHDMDPHPIASISDNPEDIIVVNTTEPDNTDNVKQDGTDATKPDNIDVTWRDYIHIMEQNTSDTTVEEFVLEVKNETQNTVSQRQPKAELPKALSIDVEAKYSENWHGFKEIKVRNGSLKSKNNFENVLHDDAFESKTTSCEFWEVFWDTLLEIEERSEKESISNSVFSEKENLSKIEEQPAISKHLEVEKHREADITQTNMLPNMKKLTEMKHRPTVDIHLKAGKALKSERLLKLSRLETETPPIMDMLKKIQKRPKLNRFQEIHRLPELEDAQMHPEKEKHPCVNRHRDELNILLKLSIPQEVYRLQEVKPCLEVNRPSGVIRFLDKQRARDINISHLEVERSDLSHPIVLLLNLIIA